MCPYNSLPPYNNMTLVVAANYGGQWDIANTVRYLAQDGMDDLDTLRIVSDDPNNPVLSIPLIAEYKGITEIAVVEDPKDSAPETMLIDFGPTSVASTRTRTIYVKNIGTGNAVLEVASVRTDPSPSLVFMVETSSGTPILLNRFRPTAICNPDGSMAKPGPDQLVLCDVFIPF